MENQGYLSIIILEICQVLMVGTLIYITYRRTIPFYKPNRHREKQPIAELHTPSGTFTIKDEHKTKVKAFSDEDIWNKLNERRDSSSDYNRY